MISAGVQKERKYHGYGRWRVAGAIPPTGAMFSEVDRSWKETV